MAHTLTEKILNLAKTENDFGGDDVSFDNEVKIVSIWRNTLLSKGRKKFVLGSKWFAKNRAMVREFFRYGGDEHEAMKIIAWFKDGKVGNGAEKYLAKVLHWQALVNIYSCSQLSEYSTENVADIVEKIKRKHKNARF